MQAMLLAISDCDSEADCMIEALAVHKNMQMGKVPSLVCHILQQKTASLDGVLHSRTFTLCVYIYTHSVASVETIK